MPGSGFGRRRSDEIERRIQAFQDLAANLPRQSGRAATRDWQREYQRQFQQVAAPMPPRDDPIRDRGISAWIPRAEEFRSDAFYGIDRSVAPPMRWQMAEPVFEAPRVTDEVYSRFRMMAATAPRGVNMIDWLTDAPEMPNTVHTPEQFAERMTAAGFKVTIR